jgi:dTMP kinase
MTTVGRLVVIEGLDGAGKRTLTDALAAELEGAGASVARLAFPRYTENIHADLVRDALHGELGDLADSVHGMALLFALDRRAAKQVLAERLAEFDVLLADRYIASNAAYGAARLHQKADDEFVAWVRTLEVERFGLPVPHAHLYLRVPVDVAAARAEHRERTETDRRRDNFESDDGLQARCADVYDQLTARDWLAPWHIVDGTRPAPVAALAKTLLR